MIYWCWRCLVVFCAQHGYKPLSYDILVYQTVRGRPYSYIPVRSRDFLEFARLDPDKTFPPSTTFRQSSLNYRRRCVLCGFGFYRIILGAFESASSLADCELNHATSPPCTVTFSNGTALPTLVEIHGLKVGVVTDDECGTVFPNQCDQSFNLCNTNLAPNCASTYPDTMHKLHSEIDMYWNRSGIAPHAPTSGALIDIQGLASCDDAHLADSWHSFSGWELHPVSAWRLSNRQGLTASFSYSPSAPTIAQPVTFTANAGGGSPPYSFSWYLGDGSTGRCC